jgi:hypothetical protein
MNYDPSSQDSMFSRIMEKLENQDHALKEIKEQVYKTNGRVNDLERDRWYQRGVVASIGIGVSYVWNIITNR